MGRLVQRLAQGILPHASALDVRLIAYGALVYMFSGVGQSYFFQFIRPDVVDAFGLSEDQFGTYYMLGTLCSGFLLMFSGRIFDWLDLRTLTIVVLVGAALSCFIFANVWFAWMLAPAIFLQRQFGQGLMSHVPVSAMAKYFTHLRGRATSICNAGYSVGEALIPQLAGLLLIIVAGWRGLYEALAFILVLGVLPLALWLLRGHDRREALHTQQQDVDKSGDVDDHHVPGSRRRQWSLAEVLRDPTVWMLAPTLFAPSFIFTGLVIFGLEFADALGVGDRQWRFLWMIYALFGFATAFPLGWLVDRLTATKLAPFTALPMALALLIVLPFDGPIIACVMLLLWALCQISTSIVAGPLFAELYGVKHIGSIKAAYSSFMVIASAGGPFLVGRLLTEGLDIKAIGLGFAAYIILACTLAVYAISRINVRPLQK